MKHLSLLLILMSLFAFLLTPHMAFAIGKKPKQKTSYDQPVIKPIQNKPSAREMQIATGEIPANNEDQSEGK